MKDKGKLQFLLVVLLAAFQPLMALGVNIPFIPSDLNPGDEYHVAFITFSGQNATSSDIDVYNTFVQGQAEQSGADTETWGISWFAFASTATVDAKDNIPVTTAPIYLLTDVRMADNATDLWDGSIQTNLSINQFGSAESSQNVWTGTGSDGTGSPTATLGTSDPRHGFSSVVDSKWISFGDEPGTNLRAFYAVSELVTVIPEPSSVLLLTFGSGGLIFYRRAKRREENRHFSRRDFIE